MSWWNTKIGKVIIRKIETILATAKSSLKTTKIAWMKVIGKSKVGKNLIMCIISTPTHTYMRVITKLTWFKLPFFAKLETLTDS